MTAERVLHVLRVLRAHGVDATVDGGWGVDALLRRETRRHEDLDLVVALEDVPRIHEALGPLGFALHEDHLPVRFTLRRDGEQLDFHTVTFDSEGGGVQPQPGGGSFRYPPEGFVSGEVSGVAVRCISAAVQLLCHLGYEPTPKDAHDVSALCRAFSLPIPKPYTRLCEPGSDTVEALILDLLEWIGSGSRPYSDVMDAWRTSCPRFPVWEDAMERGFIQRHRDEGRGEVITVSSLGREHLTKHRPHREGA